MTVLVGRSFIFFNFYFLKKIELVILERERELRRDMGREHLR